MAAATHDVRPEPANEVRPSPVEAAPAEARDVLIPPQAAATDRPDHQAAGPAADHPAETPPPAAGAPAHPWRKRLLLTGAVVGLVAGGYFLIPSVKTALNTVSTDDAYVNGHVTLVAPRVSGLVSRVLVDDNYRVKKGDLLVQLDKEPYQVQVDIKKAAVVNAETEVEVARSQVRGTLALARSQRWKLQRSMEDVDDTIAQLKARVAALRSKEATLDRARADFERAGKLYKRQTIAREEFDQRREAERTATAGVKQALEDVHEARVALGLPPHPETGDLADVPADLNQTFSGVREALAALVQSMAQVGLALTSSSKTPRQVLDEFARRDKEGNIDRVLERIIPEAPAVRHAEARLLQARSDLAQAELDLRYCDVASEIDGLVTRRSVNPGNNVQAGQSVMADRSLTEIWIDANFKETQLADLRIGHRVRCEVDMYGSQREYEGRITGFTMGTGQTLALLPPQNAT
ncbi:MAG: HlyD family secretion protein, partial [Alphaproteobacteria bacterium]|nr:HlyD family secretion protein [Alphaproteobacteria bacterium]